MVQSQPERLPLARRLLFGVGAIGENVYFGIFNGFIAIFYNQVIGLSNSLIGAAIMLAMIVDGISDPLIGVYSDRFKSRHGRRHPFLFAAPVPLAIALYFIFNPLNWLVSDPAGSTQFALFTWLCLWTILSRVFMTLYSVPHLALGGELTQDQHDRSRLFSANSIFGYASGALFSFTAWSFFFAGERIRASDGAMVPGHLHADAYLPLVIFAIATIVSAIWLCAAGTYKYVPTLSRATAPKSGFSLREFVGEMLIAVRNRNYRFIIIGFFFFMLAVGVVETLNVFLVTFFWGLQPEQIRWIGLAAAPAAVLGALAAPGMMKRFDRKPVMLSGLVGLALFAQLPIDLRLLGLMPPNDSQLLLPILMFNTGLSTFFLGFCSVAILSMLGDVVDENELLTGRRQEGLFYSARSFFAKAANSFGHFLAGVCLDLFVRMPFQAVPGEVEEGVLIRLGILAGPVVGVLVVIAFLFYRLYDLSKVRHREILSALRAKNANAG